MIFLLAFCDAELRRLLSPDCTVLIFYYKLDFLVKILKFGGSMWKIEFVVIIYILMVAAFHSNLLS